MRIAVLGAAGNTGRLVVEQALARGIDVTAMARGNGRLASLPPEVGTVEGDVSDPEALDRVLEGADAVLSVLAIPASEEPTTTLSDAVRAVVQRMQAQGPRRVVVTANTTVLNDREIKPPYRVVAEEHRRNLATLRASDLDWTMLAAVYLDDEAPADRYDAVLDEPPPAKRISRAAFAAAALDALDHADWIGHVVGVSS